MVVRAAGDQIDWDRFADQTARRHLVLPVRVALRHLHDSGLVPIPTAAIRRLDAAQAGWMDRAEYAHRQSGIPTRCPTNSPTLVLELAPSRPPRRRSSTAASFPGFLRRYAAH